MKDLLKQEPFVPFRIHLSDGMSYDVNGPSEAMAFKYAIAIGIDPDESGLPQRSTYVDPHHITRVEMLAPSGKRRIVEADNE